MHTAAKLARAGDRLVSMVAAALIVLMLLYGGYALWDTAMVYNGAFLGSDLLQFKPVCPATRTPTPRWRSSRPSTRTCWAG